MMWLRALVFAAALPASVVAASESVRDESELKPALQASVRYETPNGKVLEQIEPRQPFRVRVSIESAVADEAPAGLSLFGWLRRIDDDSAVSCGAAAESFMRTGRLPTGTVFLNDPVIGVVTDDNAFIVSDPEFSLASANVLGAARFDSRPASLAVDVVARRFLVTLPDEGRVLGLGVAGEPAGRFDGFDRPVEAVAARGGVLVREAAGALWQVDGPVRRRLDDSIRRLAPTLDARWTIAVGDGRVTLLDTANPGGTERLVVPGLQDAVGLLDREADRPFALGLLGADGLTLRYLDAVDQAISIPLPIEPTRLVAAPGGRVLFAWSPAGGPVAVIDVVRGRLVRTVGAPSPIAEIAFSDRSAFMRLADQTRVGALDLAAIERGDDAEFREVPIGSASERDDERQLLASLWPMAGLLAVHTDAGQGYRLMDDSVMGDAPAMTATALRGGVPRRVATLDRSFVEIERGVFETVTSLPGPGRFELVTTTGLGALHFCADVPVSDPTGPVVSENGQLRARRDGDRVQFELVEPDGEPAGSVEGQVVFASLVGSWRAVEPFATDAHGRSEARYRLPDLDAIIVRLELSGPHRYAPLLLER